MQDRSVIASERSARAHPSHSSPPSASASSRSAASVLAERESLAEWTGLEPATLGVTGRYSNQLNYHSSHSLRFVENVFRGRKDAKFICASRPCQELFSPPLPHHGFKEAKGSPEAEPDELDVPARTQPGARKARCARRRKSVSSRERALRARSACGERAAAADARLRRRSASGRRGTGEAAGEAGAACARQSARETLRAASRQGRLVVIAASLSFLRSRRGRGSPAGPGGCIGLQRLPRGLRGTRKTLRTLVPEAWRSLHL